MPSIEDRKINHLRLALEEYTSKYTTFKSPFDNYKFEHNALPEMDFAEVDTSTEFLGKKLDMPFIISSITGGTQKSDEINLKLAQIANDFNVGLAVGSQRIALDKHKYTGFSRIRANAKNCLLLANIGAVQLNYGFSMDECERAVSMLEADALIFHLNPLQEVFQQDGNTNFCGLLKKIENICRNLSVPVIVKEVGYGISAAVAEQLNDIGVKIIDIAGKSLISWPRIEADGMENSEEKQIYTEAAKAFENWGNETPELIQEISQKVTNVSIIASGGIRNGVDIAKSIALGADICGCAGEILRSLSVSLENCQTFLKTLSFELQTAMFCAKAQSIDILKHIKIKRLA